MRCLAGCILQDVKQVLAGIAVAGLLLTGCTSASSRSVALTSWQRNAIASCARALSIIDSPPGTIFVGPKPPALVREIVAHKDSPEYRRYTSRSNELVQVEKRKPYVLADAQAAGLRWYDSCYALVRSVSS